MKKYLRYLGPVLITALFVLAIYLLYHKLKAYSIAQIRESIQQVSTGSICFSIGLMIVNYIILVGYDWLALKAIELVFTYLPRCVHNGKNDLKAREKMHNAATIAGMAFANAFLGIVHSMAHKIGAEYHTIHGQTCAILLPHVIKYNGTQPTKLSVWPKYEEYNCDKRYLDICHVLNLPAKTPEEATQVLSDAVMNLGKEIGIDMNFASLIPDEEYYMSHLEELAYLAYEDQCTPCNPREPMIEDMIQIMKDAYKGN